jgi:hypothetical protein
MGHRYLTPTQVKRRLEWATRSCSRNGKSGVPRSLLSRITKDLQAWDKARAGKQRS